MKTLAALALPLVMLAACVPAPPPGTTPPVEGVAPEDDTCGAAPYQALVGQPATALETQLILGQVRLIRPNQPVTMDFREDRINFDIDANETITRVFCG